MKTLKSPLYLFSLLMIFVPVLARAGSTCNAGGNVCIFSNYDGSGATAATRLNINVDANIPNLKIGICTYERVTVNITGAFVGNVTAIRYAGFNAMGNNHCGSVATSNITITGGVPVPTYAVYPPGVISQPGGSANMVCGHVCTSGYNGGCNTPQEIVAYFLNFFGAGSTLNMHYTQYGCWAGATINISGGGNCCLAVVLPIELNYFNASSQMDDVLLQWETSSEKNNEYFDLERSLDGKNFESIKRLNGAGSSNENIKYQFIDESPIPGTSFYRLRQTDFDGKSTTSEIIDINHEAKKYRNLRIMDIPDENCFLIYCPDLGENITHGVSEIYDVSGRIVNSEEFELSRESNKTKSKPVALQQGIYFAKVIINGRNIATTKLIRN